MGELESTVAPIEDEIAGISLLPTSLNGVFQLTDGTQWNYRITVNEVIDTQRLPLIIGLHWGGAEGTFQRYSICLAEPAIGDFPCILFTPEDRSLGWSSEENRVLVENFIKLAIKYWPIDPSRIALTGYSNGGIGTWNYISEIPEYFSAAIPMAGLLDGNQKFELPVYAIHGSEDELFSAQTAKMAIDQSVQLGSSIKWVLAEGLTHYGACDYVDYLRDAIYWLEDEIW